MKIKPRCQGQLHMLFRPDPIPLASSVAKWHGCASILLCDFCVQSLREAFTRMTQDYPMQCSECDGIFVEFDKFIQVDNVKS